MTILLLTRPGDKISAFLIRVLITRLGNVSHWLGKRLGNVSYWLCLENNNIFFQIKTMFVGVLMLALSVSGCTDTDRRYNLEAIVKELSRIPPVTMVTRTLNITFTNLLTRWMTMFCIYRGIF